MRGPMDAEELQRYAQLIVRGCIAFKRGDTLLQMVSLGHRELAVAIAEEAYRAGALAVDVAYDDARVHAAKIELASKAALPHQTPWRAAQLRAFGEEDVAIVQVIGEFEHHVLASLDPVRLAAEASGRSRHVARIRRESRLRGTICAWPTEEWATTVFPGMTPARAQRKLARELLWFCRLGPDDPPGHAGWTAHLTTLRRRAVRLTKLDLKELEVHDDGTDLRFRIAPHSMWRGGGETDAWGNRIAMNVPTEECFISPDAASTEGTFRCSRPRSIGGRMIEGLAGEFRGGRLVRLRAKRESDRDWLARYIAASANGDRLGEIALVDSSSRIGQTGRIYYNGLLDENAAAHMAFGSGFAKTRTVPLGRARYGVNRSPIHIDVMIGTDALEAVGIRANGRRATLVADGTWQI
ncbi:MAG TPA: aminopeptidase [Gaiellaceae bacterium]